MPDVETWQLMEALSLLSVLAKADKIYTREICNILGKTGPIHFSETGSDLYLWAQQTLSGAESALAGRPDLIVTTSPDSPDAGNISRIIEAKCRKSLGAPEYVSAVTEGGDDDGGSPVDEILGLGSGDSDEARLYDRAVAIVARDRKCSTSYIQRKLQIGYNRAARLVDEMENQGVVGPANHVGKREVLVGEIE